VVHDQPIGRLPVDLADDMGRDGAVRCGRSDPVGRPVVRGRRHRHAGRGRSERGNQSHDGRSLSATGNVWGLVVFKTVVDPVDHDHLFRFGAVVDVLRNRCRSRVFGDRPTLGLDSSQIDRGRRCSGLRMTSRNCVLLNPFNL